VIDEVRSPSPLPHTRISLTSWANTYAQYSRASASSVDEVSNDLMPPEVSAYPGDNRIRVSLTSLVEAAVSSLSPPPFVSILDSGWGSPVNTSDSDDEDFTYYD